MIPLEANSYFANALILLVSNSNLSRESTQPLQWWTKRPSNAISLMLCNFISQYMVESSGRGGGGGGGGLGIFGLIAV